jgi:hypothetical protein
MLILFFSLIFSVAAFGDERPVCEHCGKKIFTKSFIEVEGHFFHKGHFLCARCGEELSPNYYFELSGKYYDNYCFKTVTSASCYYCEKPITGPYLRLKGKSYHKDCYNEYIAEECAFCGQSLEGAIIIDFWGNRYHKSHAGSAPQCTYCRRFISDELTSAGVTYADGRTICGLCNQSAINAPKMVGQINKLVQRYLTAFGIMVDIDNLEIKLIDKNKMAEIATEYTDLTQGYYAWSKKVTLTGNVVSEKSTIYMLDGMPEMHFIFTLSRQMMFVWMHQNGPREMDRGLTEGSSYYAGYLVILELGGKAADYIINGLSENRNLAYREDFFRVGRFVAENSIDVWLDYLKKNSKAPW